MLYSHINQFDRYIPQNIADVTMACDDNLDLQAAKLFLVHAMQLFYQTLHLKPHLHPLIFLRVCVPHAKPGFKISLYFL